MNIKAFKLCSVSVFLFNMHVYDLMKTNKAFLDSLIIMKSSVFLDC